MYDFPNAPTTGQQVTTPAGITYRWDGVKWVAMPGIGVADAPSDSQYYSRRNAAWAVTPSGAFADAPADGIAYGRRNVAWTQVLMSSNDIVDGGNF